MTAIQSNTISIQFNTRPLSIAQVYRLAQCLSVGKNVFLYNYSQILIKTPIFSLGNLPFAALINCFFLNCLMLHTKLHYVMMGHYVCMRCDTRSHSRQPELLNSSDPMRQVSVYVRVSVFGVCLCLVSR